MTAPRKTPASRRSTRRRRWDDDSRLPPWVVQMLGAALVVASFVFWAATGQLNTLIFTAAVGLVGGGSVSAVVQNAARRRGPGVSRGQRGGDEGDEE